MSEFESYIGIPFVELGRDRKGLDCLGLLLLIFSEKLGINFDDYRKVEYEYDWDKKGYNPILENIDNNWEQINNKKYKKYDVHIFYDNHLIPRHLGINIGNGKFIHVYENSKVRIDRLSFFSKRLYATLRFKKLEN